MGSFSFMSFDPGSVYLFLGMAIIALLALLGLILVLFGTDKDW